jgi:DNA-dependent RNA polymerase
MDMQARYIARDRLRARLLAQLQHYIDKTGGRRRPRKAAVRSHRAAEELIDLDAAEPAPPPPRRGRPKLWVLAVGELSTKVIASAILAECWRTWLHAERALPTTITVAKGIARRLGVHGGKEVQVGRALLRIAELAQVVREIRTFRKVPRIALTDEVETLLCNEWQSIDLVRAPGEGLHAEPVNAAPIVRRAIDQRLPPFEPRPGASPWTAAERVHATRWRVNRDLCAIAGRDLQAKFDKMVVEKGPRAALKELGSIRDAYEEAREGLQVGYLAVGWDHRGRLNQVDSALTYTSGSDLARAVLEFDESKPVRTEAGRWALARHVINQWSSEDARTIGSGAEQLKWIDAHRAAIQRIADEGAIVTDASHPLRLVAACRAWCAIERGEAIRLPVSIDATTSMLQHMALLLRDPDLARLSNLWPGPRQDFYMEVAKRCGSKRSIVKPVAMPMFYGQTLHSAMDVLRKVGVTKPLPLVTKIKAEGRNIAPRAFGLYEALRAVADQLTERGDPIHWTTPSGWQCVTDCRRDAKVVHTVQLPDGAVRQYTEAVPGEQLHADRQRNAITANLIHSCDASLLHLAVAALPAEVVSIAVAHDCFAVHADDVSVLRTTLMDTLRRMYDSDLLAQWWEKWETDVPLPTRGKWDSRFTQGEYAFC